MIKFNICSVSLGVALTLASSVAAQDNPSRCSFEELTSGLQTLSDEDQLWDCYETLVENPDLSTRLMMEAALQTSDPRVVLYLAEVGASLWSEGNEETALDVVLRQNPDTTVAAVLFALGASHSLMTDRAPSVRPEHDRLVALFVEADGAFRFPPPDASVDCSDFLTARFITEASPGQVRYCQQNVSYMSRDEEENSSLHLAARYSNNPFVIDAIIGALREEQRLDYLDARNSADETALHVAARHARDPEIVSALLVHGANPNALAREEYVRFRQNRGNTPLHLATRHFDPDMAVEIVARLLAAGADMSIQRRHSDDDLSGAMVLHLAAHDPSDDTLLWLLVEAAWQTGRFFDGIRENWMDRNRDEANRTALHYLAISSDLPEAFDTLLSYGLSPDAEDSGGRTPLIVYANRGSDPQIMHWLIDESEAPCHTDSEGFSALAYARSNPAFHPATGEEYVVSPRDRLIDECG